MEKYSKQLEGKFIQILKVKFPGEAKKVNDLWEDYSKEKYHIEFRRTQWKNLEEFVEHLKANKTLAVTGTFPNCKITYLVSKASDFFAQQKRKQTEWMRIREKEHQDQSLKGKMDRLREADERNFERMEQEMKRRNQEIVEKEEDADGLFLRFDGFGKGKKRNPVIQTDELEN